MPATRRTTRSRPGLLVSVACLAALGLAGCSGSEAPEPPPADPPSTSLADLDLDALILGRRDPCSGIAPEVLAEVAGEGHGTVRTWRPGDSLPDISQLGDEYGCEVEGPDATARAWVFAPPVTRSEARSLVAETTAGKCRGVDAESYGTPGVAFTCDLNSGDTLHGMRGLVGDTWLACEVQQSPGSSSPDASDPSPAERWCVAVLGSLRG